VLFQRVFWLETGERALRTFAQTLAALIGAGAIGLHEFAWVTNLSIAGMAAVASVLTAVASPDRVVKPIPVDTGAWVACSYNDLQDLDEPNYDE